MVREGYKKTEVGEIPVEWKVKFLKDICDINPKKQILNEHDKVSFIAMEHVSNSGNVNNCLEKEYHEVAKGYTGFRNRDVLLAKITPCFENGKRAIVDDLINEIGFGSTEFHVLRAKKNISSSKFIYYYIATYRFRAIAQLNMTGSAGQKRIPTTFLNEIKLAVPPLKEQQKIAEILSTLDCQIDDTDKLIEKTRELKKGLMQKLLTKGIGHKEFKKTEVGEIPVEWEVRDIIDIADTTSGGTPNRSKNYYYENGDVCWIKTGELNNKYIYNTGEKITKEAIKESSAKLIPMNSVIFAMYGATIGKMSINKVITTTNQACCSIICKKELMNYEFLYYYLSFIKDKLIYLGAGGAQPNISQNIIKKFKVILPQIDEQEKIANILSLVDTQIEEYENKKSKLEYLKKGLMQQLLTGKLRVKV